MPFPRGVRFDDQNIWIERLDRLFDEVEDLEGRIQAQYSTIQRFKDNLIRSVFDGRLES